MLLIISAENDVSTKKVINWLIYYDVPYKVINEVDFVKQISLIISNDEINFDIQFENEKAIKLSEIGAFWYRRGLINKLNGTLPNENLRKYKELHLHNEWSRLQYLLHTLIEKNAGIGNFETSVFLISYIN